MTDKEGAAHAKLLAEYRALEEEYAGQDEIPDEIDTRLGVLETEMEKIETQPLIFDPLEIRQAGAFDRYSALAVYRGYVRPEDEPVEETAGVQHGTDPAVARQGDDRDLTDSHGSAAHGGTVIMSGGQPISADLPEDEDHGTLKLVTDTFRTSGASGSRLEASVRQVYMSA